MIRYFHGAFLWVLCAMGMAPLASVEPPLPGYEVSMSKESRFLYFIVTKTGSRTMLRLLRTHLSCEIGEYHNVTFDPSEWEGCFKFAFVRNPWDRVVSCYFNKVKSRNWPLLKECWGMTFEEFVDWLSQQDLARSDIHCRPQVHMIPVKDLDYVARFEDFEAEIRVIFACLGCPDIPYIPKANPSYHDHYSVYYDDRTRELVGYLYREDIESFGYAFEELQNEVSDLVETIDDVFEKSQSGVDSPCVISSEP